MEERRDGRARHGGRHVPLGAAPARRVDAGRARQARRSAACPAAASRARCTSSASRCSRDGRPVLQRYGVSDDDAFAVGLTCGGILDIFVEKVEPRDATRSSAAVAEAVRTESPVAVATVVAGPAERLGKRLVVWPDQVDGGTGSQRLDDAVRDDARGLLDAGRNAMVTYGVDGQRRGEGLSVFVESFAPPPRMIVFGAIDFAAAVREDRLVPRLPGHGVRRAAGVRHGVAVPGRATRWSSSGRTATSPPRRRPGGSTSAPCCASSPTTRSSTCRCWRWRCGCRRSPTSGPWGPGAPTTTGWSGCASAGITEAEIARMSSPDRARPRRPHPGGDGRLDRRGDDRAALGRRGRPARRPRGPDPRGALTPLEQGRPARAAFRRTAQLGPTRSAQVVPSRTATGRRRPSGGLTVQPGRDIAALSRRELRPSVTATGRRVP